MNEQLMIEVKVEDRPLVEEALAAYPNEVDILETKNLTGFEVLLLMLKFGPGAISAGLAIYNTFKKKDKNVTIVLPGGKRIENPTQEQIEKLLTEDTKDDGAA